MTLLTPGTFTVNGAPADELPAAAGVYDIETRIAHDRPARFTLALPVPAADIRTLVLVLHYAGQPTRFYGRPLAEDLFAPAWRALAPAVVAPESLGGPWHEEANEAWVMQLLERIATAFDIAPARTVVAGYSMGAIGTWHLITHYPERFAAAVPVAGLPAAEPDTCSVPVHMLATPGDEIFDYARIEAFGAAACARGCAVELSTVDARGHYDVGAFAPALAELVPWLEGVLAEDPDDGD